ncbi:MAG: GAF domain-containing protein [Candidatus Methanosuratincola sp.]
MGKLAFSSLRARLLILVCLAVIPALGLILYTAAEQRRVAAEDAQADAQWLAQLIASDQERLIAETRQLLLTLAHLPAVQSEDPSACSSLFAKLLQQYPQYSNLAVVSPRGEITCSALPNPVPVSLAGQPYIQRAIDERIFSAGNYQIDELSNTPTINFAYPVQDESYRVKSVVVASLDLRWLNQVIGNSQLPEGAALIIIDRNEAVIVHHPHPERWIGKTVPEGSEIHSSISSTTPDPALISGLDGVKRLYAFKPLKDITDTGFFIGVGVSQEQAYARANQILFRDLRGLGIVFGLALLAAWLGGDLFILGQVRSLLQATRQLTNGNLDVRSGIPYGQGELGQLAYSFDLMTDALKQREIERKQAEDEIIRHNKSLAAINTITAAVSSSLELPEILESLKNLLVEGLNVPGGIILFYDENNQMLNVEAAWGLPAAALSEFKHFPASRFHYASVVRDSQPVIYPDFREVRPFSSIKLASSRPTWKSYLCVPLLAKGKVQGVLDLFSEQPFEFSNEDVVLFTALGQQVGVAIQNARLFEQNRTGRRQLQMLSQQLLEAQERERRHIARELHDEIGQALTAVKVNLQSVKRLTESSELTSPLNDSIGLVERTLQQVRDLSLDLRPSLLDDLGVVSALRWYIDRQAQRAGFEARFVTNLPEKRLPSDLETTCFRVVQEALTNILRHAQATEVWIELRQEETTLVLSIRDNGIGFDVETVVQNASGDLGLGILGMKERVQLIGGEINIQSTQPHGTEVLVKFPIVAEGSVPLTLSTWGSEA